MSLWLTTGKHNLVKKKGWKIIIDFNKPADGNSWYIVDKVGDMFLTVLLQNGVDISYLLHLYGSNPITYPVHWN